VLAFFLFFFTSVNRISAVRIIDINTKINRQIKLFSEEYITDFVFMNQGPDVIMNNGLLLSNNINSIPLITDYVVKTDFYDSNVANLKCKISDKLSFDRCGKFFFIHQNIKNGINLPCDVLIEFSNTNLQRVCVGTKLLYNVNKLFGFYGGKMIYGYEFNDTIDAIIFDMNIDMLSFKNDYASSSAQGRQERIDYSDSLMITSRNSFAVSDYAKKFIGNSIKKFKNEKIGNFDKVFKMSKSDCFTKTIDLIKNLKAKVTCRNFRKGYITAFNFSERFPGCLDSTEIGIFMVEMNNSDIKVNVISNNSLLAKEFSVRFFKEFGK
jgi:hypothetical protein